MSRYSDHTTVGGQVLAHRVRMMRQNWYVIWLVGRMGFLLGFVFYLITKWNIHEILNYLVCLKAVYRNGMTTLPSALFSSSYFYFGNGKWREISDYIIAKSEECLRFKSQFEDSLWIALAVALFTCVASMIVMLIINKFFGKFLSDSKELIMGHDYVDAQTLKHAIDHKSDTTLAGIPYPKGAEYRHTIITGTTGSGKSNVFHELLQQILYKHERAIVVDTVGTYVNDYFRPDRDVLLNPLDYRALSWNFLDECGSDQVLLQKIAECLIDDRMTTDTFWEEAARIVFAETAKKIISSGRTTADFLKMLKRPAAEWQELLKDTYGSSLMDKDAEKMAISIRAKLINATSCFEYLKESDENAFSIKNWIESGTGLLFFSCTPAQRASIVPMIAAWITIASEALLQIPPTDRKTWFFIDELHNLKRLPKIETSLAEVRKCGGCFVLGTQMVSQLNDIYSYEVARTITGLCGTKVVMNVPEPSTAKYMSGFLGDKEEISVTEAISYGANTTRDGVNIAQRKDIREVVPSSEIMNLKTGEAFIRFAGVELIGKVKFEFHDHNMKNMRKTKVFGEVLDLAEYRERNADLFGDYFGLAGLDFSEKAYKYPIFTWANEEKTNACIKEIIAEARKRRRTLLIFEESDSLYNEFSRKDDCLLNPLIADGCSWNFWNDFKNNDRIVEYMRKSTLIDCAEYLQIFKKYRFKDTFSFLNVLCFAPISDVQSILNKIVPKTIENVEQIRNALAEEFGFLSILLEEKQEMSLTDSDSIIWIPDANKIPKLSRFIIDTCDIMKVVLLKNSHGIKAANTIVFNPSFDEFHTRFDGSFLALGKTKSNKEVAKLFGITSTVMTSADGQKCFNINQPAVEAEKLKNEEEWWKWRGEDEVLRLNGDTIENIHHPTLQ